MPSSQHVASDLASNHLQGMPDIPVEETKAVAIDQEHGLPQALIGGFPAPPSHHGTLGSASSQGNPPTAAAMLGRAQHQSRVEGPIGKNVERLWSLLCLFLVKQLKNAGAPGHGLVEGGRKQATISMLQRAKLRHIHTLFLFAHLSLFHSPSGPQHHQLQQSQEIGPAQRSMSDPAYLMLLQAQQQGMMPRRFETSGMITDAGIDPRLGQNPASFAAAPHMLQPGGMAACGLMPDIYQQYLRGEATMSQHGGSGFHLPSGGRFFPSNLPLGFPPQELPPGNQPFSSAGQEGNIAPRALGDYQMMGVNRFGTAGGQYEGARLPLNAMPPFIGDPRFSQQPFPRGFASNLRDAGAGMGSYSGAASGIGSQYVNPPFSRALDFTEEQQQEGKEASSSSRRKVGDPIMLYLPSDDLNLSEYQCLARRQIELFAAQQIDVDSNAQGRNKPIVMGQVGIRCRHCAKLPPRHRSRGATYYPAQLKGLYQAAQNMASNHLCLHCQHIPASFRRELLALRERKSSAGGGKQYWANGARVLGVVEDESDNILRFRE